MNAQLKPELPLIERIERRALDTPEWKNTWLDVQSKWIRDNTDVLKEWWEEMGYQLGLNTEAPAFWDEFPIFCVIHYERECERIDANRDDWDQERADEAYDAGRAL